MASTFRSAAAHAFQMSNLQLFTANGLTTAIFVHDGHYFIFDSHARNDRGAPDSNGNAVLLHLQIFMNLTVTSKTFILHTNSLNYRLCFYNLYC